MAYRDQPLGELALSIPRASAPERYRAVSGWRGHCSQSKTGKAFN